MLLLRNVLKNFCYIAIAIFSCFLIILLSKDSELASTSSLPPNNPLQISIWANKEVGKLSKAFHIIPGLACHSFTHNPAKRGSCAFFQPASGAGVTPCAREPGNHSAHHSLCQERSGSPAVTPVLHTVLAHCNYFASPCSSGSLFAIQLPCQ